MVIGRALAGEERRSGYRPCKTCCIHTPETRSCECIPTFWLCWKAHPCVRFSAANMIAWHTLVHSDYAGHPLSAEVEQMTAENKASIRSGPGLGFKEGGG